MQSFRIAFAFHGEPQDAPRQLVRLHCCVADRLEPHPRFIESSFQNDERLRIEAVTPGVLLWRSDGVIAARLRQFLGQRAYILSRYAPIFAATLSASSRSMASQRRSSKNLKV